MKRIAGITILLVTVMIVTTMIDSNFLTPYNLRNVLRWTGLFGLISIGVAFPIMTNGIDLSVGSIVGLIGATSAHLLSVKGLPIPLVMAICLVIALVMGITHGLLITKLKMAPFIVTLCGLFIYRGLARITMNDITQGYGNRFLELRFLANGRIPEAFWPSDKAPMLIRNWSIPMPFVILMVVGVLLAIFLNRTIYGRYILSIGRNERAARYSGIDTDKMTIIAYTISTVCAALAGILFSLDLNTVQPSTAGNMYELYAIAGCVVGGVSLQGGEGNITGVIIGTAIVRVLYNAINIIGIATTLEFAVIGGVILIGVGADSVIKSVHSRMRIAEVRGNKRNSSPVVA